MSQMIRWTTKHRETKPNATGYQELFSEHGQAQFGVGNCMNLSELTTAYSSVLDPEGCLGFDFFKGSKIKNEC